jgi:hypothetical protein
MPVRSAQLNASAAAKLRRGIAPEGSRRGIARGRSSHSPPEGIRAEPTGAERLERLGARPRGIGCIDAMGTETSATGHDAEPVAVTFRGRGLAILHGSRMVLKICPLCSQRNARPTAEKGICNWCAYTPSRADAEPVPSPVADTPLA